MGKPEIMANYLPDVYVDTENGLAYPERSENATVGLGNLVQVELVPDLSPVHT